MKSLSSVFLANGGQMLIRGRPISAIWNEATSNVEVFFEEDPAHPCEHQIKCFGWGTPIHPGWFHVATVPCIGSHAGAYPYTLHVYECSA